MLLWVVFLIFVPGLVYRTQSRWFPAPARDPAVALFGVLLAVSCEERREPRDAVVPTTALGDAPATEASSPAPAQTATIPGTVTGRVVYHGPLPEKTTMYVSEAGNLEAHTIIVDSATAGLKNAVVWLEGLPREKPVPEREPALMDQRDWTFVPHVIAVCAGQSVSFRNSDIANHNVHSYTPGNAFNIGSSTGIASTQRFRHPTDAEPVRLGCDLHPWMRAWIYVFQHTGFAVSDPTGEFRIEDVPPGRWTLRVHHADGDLEGRSEVAVAAGAVTRTEVEALTKSE